MSPRSNFANNRLVPNPMEPRAAIGDYEEGEDAFTLHTTSQNPHVARLIISAFIGLAPEHKLRVVAPDVGGGFGSKIFVYAEEVVCLWAARRLKRPVKWACDRTEAFLCDAHGRDHVTKAELATDKDGKITRAAGEDDRQYGRLPVDLRVVGADLSLRDAALGPVRDPGDLRGGRRGLHQHRARSTPIAGAGRPEATFVVERLVEVAAREIGMDPVEFRRKNFVKSFPHQTPVIMMPTTRAITTRR